MSQKQPRGVRYSNAINYGQNAYSNEAPAAVSRVRGRMSVAVRRKRAEPRAPSPPQRETSMPSAYYRGSHESVDEGQDTSFSFTDQSQDPLSFPDQSQDPFSFRTQSQDTSGFSTQSGPTASPVAPDWSNPFPLSPISIQDSPDRRVADNSSTVNSSSPTPARIPARKSTVSSIPARMPARMPTPDFDHNPEGSIRSEVGVDGPSLASWLVPSSDRPQGKERRKKKPLKGENRGSLHLQATKEAFPLQQWASTSGERSGGTSEDGGGGCGGGGGGGCDGGGDGGGGDGGGDGGGGGGRLSVWLEPGVDPARGKKRVKSAGGKGKVGDVVQRYSGRSDEEEGDSGKWMSERLGGLDPSGEARAKDSWSSRERRNLTSTDIALAATSRAKSRGKRKSKWPRGWRTQAGGGKVFVTPSRSGSSRGGPSRGGAAVLASGQQAAFRMPMRGGGRRGAGQR